MAEQLEEAQLEEVEPHFRSPEGEEKKEREEKEREEDALPLPFTGPGEFVEEEGEPDAFYVQDDDALEQRVNAVLSSYQASRPPLVIGNPASLVAQMRAIHIQRLSMYEEPEIMGIFRYCQVSFQCGGPLALLFFALFSHFLQKPNCHNAMLTRLRYYNGHPHLSPLLQTLREMDSIEIEIQEQFNAATLAAEIANAPVMDVDDTLTLFNNATRRRRRKEPAPIKVAQKEAKRRRTSSRRRRQEEDEEE